MSVQARLPPGIDARNEREDNTVENLIRVAFDSESFSALPLEVPLFSYPSHSGEPTASRASTTRT